MAERAGGRVDAGAAPLRLTRRGRLAITTSVTTMLVVAMALVTGVGSSARPESVADGAAPAAAADSAPSAVGTAPPSPSPSTGQPVEPTQEQPVEPTPVPEQAVAQSGTGRLAVVPGQQTPSDDRGRTVRYRVQVEDGLTVDGDPVDGDEFARTVHEVLTDERGWQPLDGVRFERVDDGDYDVDVVLASPDTTDALCEPLGTGGWLSCFNGYATVLNARRWFSGAETYGDDLVSYRRYLVSHEMGHYLGHQHEGCPAPGAPAPVMVQQTKSLDGCSQNPWPAGA
jgi:hypothetical protein